MTKLQFILELRDKISSMPKADIEERLTFYSEMIDDRMEEGLSEAQAVEEIGSVDEIAKQIIDDAANNNFQKEPAKLKRKLKAWEIVLLVLGSPLWLSLLIAGVAIILSVYISWWSVIVSLWAVFASLCAFSIYMLVGFGIISGGNGFIGIALIGAGIFSIGTAIFLFFGCKAITELTLKYTKKGLLSAKNYFFKREEA